jgi:hypothetical protein
MTLRPAFNAGNSKHDSRPADPHLQRPEQRGVSSIQHSHSNKSGLQASRQRSGRCAAERVAFPSPPTPKRRQAREAMAAPSEPSKADGCPEMSERPRVSTDGGLQLIH